MYFFDIFVQLTKCEDTLLQQKAELIFRDNIPHWKVNLVVVMVMMLQKIMIIKAKILISDELVA